MIARCTHRREVLSANSGCPDLRSSAFVLRLGPCQARGQSNVVGTPKVYTTASNRSDTMNADDLSNHDEKPISVQLVQGSKHVEPKVSNPCGHPRVPNQTMKPCPAREHGGIRKSGPLHGCPSIRIQTMFQSPIESGGWGKCQTCQVERSGRRSDVPCRADISSVKNSVSEASPVPRLRPKVKEGTIFITVGCCVTNNARGA